MTDMYQIPYDLRKNMEINLDNQSRGRYNRLVFSPNKKERTMRERCNMKVLSVAIPCYNSKEYMRHAIDTLLTGGEEVEIIIVNDGSKDDTQAIAEEYAARFPSQIIAVSQENGGHGEAVNTGLKHATGLYYKVVDSDDWVDEVAFKKMLQVMKDYIAKNQMVDMYMANYVYEKVALNKQKVMKYTGIFPENRIFGWDEVGHFKQSQYVIMHSVFYRTQMLKECGLKLPKHTFYVDNIFVYYPLPFVKTMVYVDVDLYRYFIGREDQSVNEKVMMGRMDQQLRVTRQMIRDTRVEEIKEDKLRKYMVKYMTMMMTICTVFLLKRGQNQDIEDLNGIWEYLETTDPALASMVKKTFLGRSIRLKGRAGKRIILWGYAISQKIFGFN